MFDLAVTTLRIFSKYISFFYYLFLHNRDMDVDDMEEDQIYDLYLKRVLKLCFEGAP